MSASESALRGYNNEKCASRDCTSESGNVVVLLEYMNGNATRENTTAFSSSYAPSISILNGLCVRKVMKTKMWSTCDACFCVFQDQER